MSIELNARDAFRDRYADILTDDELTEGQLPPVYWQDDIHEMADSLVPVYNSDRVHEWMEAGYPAVNDSGLIEGVTDVMQIIGVALYERYSAELYELAYAAGFNN